MAGEVIKQGEVSVGGTILFTGGKNGSKVVVMRIFNPAAYVLQLFSYQNSSTSTIQMFDFTLDAGDVVTDYFTYSLNDGDYIEVFTDVVGTEYYVRCFDN